MMGRVSRRDVDNETNCSKNKWNISCDLSSAVANPKQIETDDKTPRKKKENTQGIKIFL